MCHGHYMPGNAISVAFPMGCFLEVTNVCIVVGVIPFGYAIIRTSTVPPNTENVC